MQENERLRKKMIALKRAVLSDKSHKAMKQEALEVLSLLTSMEDFLNNLRGIIREEDFSHSLFEDRFLKELSIEMEAEVIT